MSGPVDVLAGIRLAALDCTAQGNQMAANELLDIKAAVAELIEACKYMSSHADVAQWTRFHAALANVGSAS